MDSIEIANKTHTDPKLGLGELFVLAVRISAKVNTKVKTSLFDCSNREKDFNTLPKTVRQTKRSG